MKIEQIDLDRLVVHPANANVMGRERMYKLKRHIGAGGNYEPLVVRRHPKREGYYQIINGHHRKRVLEQLKHKQANCVVWEVTDKEALMLLATLNRLTGDDHPEKRADLLERLKEWYDPEDLLGKLPETQGQLEKMLLSNKRPEVIRPGQLGEMPQAMIFFVNREQRKRIDGALKKVQGQRGEGSEEKKLSRGDMLELLALKVQNGL